jgi:hypothetical protein
MGVLSQGALELTIFQRIAFHLGRAQAPWIKDLAHDAAKLAVDLKAFVPPHPDGTDPVLARGVGDGADDDFLSTQGDVWDTQWDMLSALVGAIVSQLSLARVHDWELHRLMNR